MSFILDALKKSETDRQRQNGPALFEVRVAPPRDKLPLWAVGLGVLLAVNLVIVAWVLLRRPASAEVASHGSPGSQGGAAVVQPPPGQSQVADGANVARGAPAGYGAPGGYGAPAAYGAGASPTAAGAAGMAQTAGMTAGGAPQSTGQQSGSAQESRAQGPGAQGPGWAQQSSTAQQPGAAPLQAGAAQQQLPGPPSAAAYAGNSQAGAGGTPPAPVAANGAPHGAATEGGEKLNPDDYAPAADPAPQSFGNHVTRGTASGVPLYQDVASANHLPDLRLDLHVYAAVPQDRFVMINMHKLHEGDSMQAEGVRVETITPFGAVLSHDGTKFLLPRD